MHWPLMSFIYQVSLQSIEQIH